MTDREAQVVALLRLVDEWVPGPGISRVYAGGKPGAVGSADGYVSDRSTAFAARFGDDRRVSSLRRDAEIRRLELARLHEAGGTDSRDLEGWERAKRALFAQSSMPDLLVVLEALRRELGVYAVTALRVVFGYDGDLRFVDAPLLRREAEVALSWVAGRMPAGEVRVPACPSDDDRLVSECGLRSVRGERARERRDGLIREAAAAGVRQKDLAVRFRLSEQAVSQIVRRREGTEAA